MAVDRRELTPATIAAGDPSGQIEHITALGAHLRDAVERVDAAQLSLPTAVRNVVAVGMGGSAIGSRIAAAVVEPQLHKPLTIVQDYTLPQWVGPETLVFCSSYSGGTEEVLACYEAARKVGAPLVVATVGGELGARAAGDGIPVVELPAGFQPRATIGYGTAVALEVFVACGAVADSESRAEIARAADVVDQLVEQWGPASESANLAKTLAEDLLATIPVVVGGGLTAPVAYRWKCQFNENSKLAAFANELPECNHNELVAYNETARDAQVAAVFLRDPGVNERVDRRFELTGDIAESSGLKTFGFDTRGQTRLERALSLVLLGDLVSLYLAVLRGVDPAEITVLEKLKVDLARAS